MTIGRLAVQITADTAGLASGLTAAGRQTDAFESRLGGLTSKLKLLGPAAIAAGGAFAIGMVRSVANTADELSKLSARTGVAVEDLSRLQYAAGLSGVSNETLTASIDKLSRGMADAANGTGTAAEAFKAMGLSVKNQDGTLKSQSEMMSELAEKFANYADGAEKTALAQQIFGRSGAQLIPLLNSGAQGLKDMADESDRLGNTISGDTAKAAERFNDNLSRMTTLAGGLARELSGPMIQSLADVTDRMIEAQRAGRGFLGVLSSIFESSVGNRKILDQAAADIERINQAIATMLITSNGRLNPKQQLDLQNLSTELQKATANYDALRAAQDAATGEGAGGRKAPTVSEGSKKTPQSNLIDQLDAVDAEIAKRMERREELYIQDLERRLEFLRQSVLTEEQIAAEKHTKEMETLIAAYDEKILTEQEYMLLTQDLEMRHMDELARIREAGLKRMGNMTKQSWQQQAQTVAQQLQAMTQSAASGSKAMFNINKAASIANALLSARESVTNAYRFGSRIGGPALGAAFAATAAVATAAQIRQLSSTSFNSGATVAGSVSAGGATAPSALPAATLPNTAQAAGAGGRQTVTIQIQGETFGREAVRNLISEINEAISDGAVLRLA